MSAIVHLNNLLAASQVQVVRLQAEVARMREGLERIAAPPSSTMVTAHDLRSEAQRTLLPPPAPRTTSRWLYESASQLIKSDEQRPDLVLLGYEETELVP